MKFYYTLNSGQTIEMLIPEQVYYPREDSIFFANLIQNYLYASHAKSILDMGTGSGFLAIVCALSSPASVTAVDKDRISIECARDNIESLGLGKKINIVQSDLFNNINERFDLIIFNPPYLPEADENKYLSKQEKSQLSDRDVIKKFLEIAKNYLTKNGRIVILFSSATKIKFSGYDVKTLVKKKLEWEELVIYELRPK
ncbi:MAG: methyltransferase [Candidatus Aenigmarchaeota archaeon]|nr:methyltransferase [Candidatus Aenigmarchaeota archaeon]